MHVFHLLKKFIVKLLDSIPDSEFYSIFNHIVRMSGFVLVECGDTQSIEWLKSNILDIKTAWDSG